MPKALKAIGVFVLITLVIGVVYFWSDDTRFFLSATAGVALAMASLFVVSRIVRIGSLRSTFFILVLCGLLGGVTFGFLYGFYPWLSAVLGGVLLPFGYWAESGLRLGDPRLILRRTATRTNGADNDGPPTGDGLERPNDP